MIREVNESRSCLILKSLTAMALSRLRQPVIARTLSLFRARLSLSSFSSSTSLARYSHIYIYMCLYIYTHTLTILFKVNLDSGLLFKIDFSCYDSQLGWIIFYFKVFVRIAINEREQFWLCAEGRYTFSSWTAKSQTFIS